jgi:hypothetical protein
MSFAMRRVYSHYHPIGAIPRYLLDREQEEPGVFVPNLIRKCVAFIGIQRDDGSFEPKATVFLPTPEKMAFSACIL